MLSGDEISSSAINHAIIKLNKYIQSIKEKGIIFGALDKDSIAWKTAERIKRRVENLFYQCIIAIRMGSVDELAKKTKSKLISADATKLDDLEHLIKETMKIFGGKIDFVLHSRDVS